MATSESRVLLHTPQALSLESAGFGSDEWESLGEVQATLQELYVISRAYDSGFTVDSDQHKPLMLSGQPGSVPDFRSSRSSVPDRVPGIKHVRATCRETDVTTHSSPVSHKHNTHFTSPLGQ